MCKLCAGRKLRWLCRCAGPIDIEKETTPFANHDAEQSIQMIVGHRQLLLDRSHPAVPPDSAHSQTPYARPAKEWGLDAFFEKHPTARVIFFIESACGQCDSCKQQKACLATNPTGVPGAQPVHFGGVAAEGNKIVRIERDAKVSSLKLGHLCGGKALSGAFEASQKAASVTPGTVARDGWKERRDGQSEDWA